MKLLVTGALGVNGAWVVRALLEQGHDVVGTDVRPDWTLLEDLRGDFELLEVDVCDVDALERVVRERGIEVVAHLAAIVPAQADPHRAFAVNAQGTVNALEAARRAGTRRVVFTSSRAVYGLMTGRHGAPDYLPIDEDYPRTPLAAMRVYSVSKILGEEAGRQYHEAFGLEFTALRFSTIYGPGKKARHGPIGVHTRMIENALLGERTVVERGGDERDDTIYVKDVAAGIVRACTVATLPSWAYNISTGRVSSLRDFADAVRSVLPEADIEVGGGYDPLGLGPLYCALDPARARAELGFSPAYSLADGVRDFIASMDRLGMRPEAQLEASRW
jgi:UDP-glucose 4-epimerase